MTIITYEGPMGSGMTMAALAFAYMRSQIDKRKVVSNYLETKYNIFPFDEAMDMILKSTLSKNLFLLEREEAEIERALKKRPWLLDLTKTNWRHSPKKTLECDIYYHGRKLGNDSYSNC